MLSSKKGIAPVAIIVAVVVVLLIGVGAYLVIGRGGGGASNEARIDQAFHKLLDQTSADVQVTAAIDARDDVTITANVSGFPLPGNTEERSLMQGSVHVEGMAEGKPLAVDAAFRSIPPRTYFQLSSLAIPDAGDSASLMSSILNKWIFVEAGEDTGQMGEMMEDMSPISLPQDCSPTPAQKAAVQDYLDSLTFTDFFTDIQTVGADGMWNGDTDRSATRFSMQVDAEAIHEVQHRLEELSGCAMDEEDEEDTPTVTKFEVLVGDQTGLVRGIDVTLQGADGDETTVTVIELRLSNFGNSPAVEAPQGAVSMEELMNQIMQQMMGQMMGPSMGTSVNGGTVDYVPGDIPSKEDINDYFQGTGMEFNLP